MFHVSADLKKRVNDKLMECAKLSGINVGNIEVRYDINSKHLGGQAFPGRNVIRLNPVYLNAHTDHYIATTVPHEWAHIAACHKYGMRIAAHGPEWKATMRQVGVQPTRCHNYTVPEGVKVGKQRAKYKCVCAKCDSVIEVGAKVRSKLEAGATYKHNRCGGRIVVAGQATPASAPVAVSSPMPAGGSKLDKCRTIWSNIRAANLPRAAVIQLFIDQAGCTPAGAATYYAKVSKQ